MILGLLKITKNNNVNTRRTKLVLVWGGVINHESVYMVMNIHGVYVCDDDNDDNDDDNDIDDDNDDNHCVMILILWLCLS